ncbi:MAG: histidine ammonia-lyase [Bacteroidetes bacterium]|nr:histidine ammonia-lyase [Bacteroidota bacterium]MDF2453914.1 histidine ammonia-lyase [Bacteroidota bacterium]
MNINSMNYSIHPEKRITLSDVQHILESNVTLVLSEKAKQNIVECREYLDKKMASQKEPIYGINTGFGSLCNVIIPDNELEQLQTNLVMSHACGMGDEVPLEIVRLMLFLKIQSLSYGKSAVQLKTVERLIDLYNLKVYPIIYQQGSLGASGDLSPLAHLSLPLLGMGEVNYQGNKYQASVVLKQLGLEPITLKSKEGLALLNGTQFMSAYGVWCLIKSNRLNALADFIGAISLDGFDGRSEPFKDNIHVIRPHKGQLQTARAIIANLSGSEILAQKKVQVQDPYSFRCIPQVHGATKDATAYVNSVFETEINSVTDNPTVFPEDDEIISGGNFHGQPLAITLDFLAIAIAELGNISERRVYQLISGTRNLPAFLVAKPGLNSGFMIPQYTAASIVSQNKQLCTPASIDSIVSSNGQEDHVSMGANAATKCYKVIENVEKLLAIELLNASQAIEFRRPLQSSQKVEKTLADFRKLIPFIKDDKIMYQELEATLQFVKTMNI